MEGSLIMSWAAHEFENFFFLRILSRRVSYLGLLVGSALPDFLSKFYTYGFEFGAIHFQADNPAQWQRGWPGMGFTTSFIAGLIFAGLIYLISKRNMAWFIGILVGYWAHVISDTFDTVGTLMFWPFYNENISVGMWAYGAQEGKLGDSLAYFSGLGSIVDMAWILIIMLFAWRVLSREFFIKVVKPADPAWGWLERKLKWPERVQLAFFRAFFFYSFCRVISWTIWAHLIEGASWDLSWGGPQSVTPFVPW